MTMPNERTTLAQYEETLHHIEAGIPAVRLENATWRLTAIPEDNGRIVELLYKPTGRELFSGTRQNLHRGTFEDRARAGFDDRNPRAFTAVVVGNTLIMEKRLPDRFVFQRKITLSDHASHSIVCETRLTHRGAKPVNYQFLVYPEFDIDSRFAATDSVAVYVNDQGWQPGDAGWNPGEGAIQQSLDNASGGAFAFFNHDTRFGIRARFDPAQGVTPRVYFNRPASQLNLELLTPVVELKRGESLAIRYSFEYLNEPPQ